MILDDHDDEPPDDDEDLAGIDDDNDEGEWLDGLRAAGLPVRAEPLLRPDPMIVARMLDSAVIDSGVRQLVAGALARSTITAYERDWQRFGGWCAFYRVDPIDADPAMVAGWIAELVARGLTPATLYRRLAAIAYAFDLAGRPSPTADRLVRKTIAGARRRLGTAPRRAIPLTLDELRRIVAAIAIITGHPYTHPIVQRDRTLLLVGWAAALRRSELVNLDTSDLAFEGDPDTGTTGGMLITIRTSKTDQTRTGAAIAVPWSQHLHSCPVRAAMRLARTRRPGPLFVAIDRHGNPGRRLTPAAVNVMIKRYVHTVLQTDPTDYTGHSLRAGFVTEARAHRVPDMLIARHTRHKDLRMLNVYDWPTDLFNDPALAGEWW